MVRLCPGTVAQVAISFQPLTKICTGNLPQLHITHSFEIALLSYTRESLGKLKLLQQP